jgi:hypothetical protein
VWWLKVVSLGVQEFVSDFWQVWGGECVMLLLLVAAFISANACSLLYLSLVGLGMVSACAGSSAPAAAPAAAAGGLESFSRLAGSSSSHQEAVQSGRRTRHGGPGRRDSSSKSTWWWHMVVALLVLVLVRLVDGADMLSRCSWQYKNGLTACGSTPGSPGDVCNKHCVAVAVHD